MGTTGWYRYASELIGKDTAQAAAAKAGFNASAFSRWKRGASAEPEAVVKLARAYGANVLEALAASEIITIEESRTFEVPIGRQEALDRTSTIELLDILRRRALAESFGDSGEREHN